MQEPEKPQEIFAGLRSKPDMRLKENRKMLKQDNQAHGLRLSGRPVKTWVHDNFHSTSDSWSCSFCATKLSQFATTTVKKNHLLNCKLFLASDFASKSEDKEILAALKGVEVTPSPIKTMLRDWMMELPDPESMSPLLTAGPTLDLKRSHPPSSSTSPPTSPNGHSGSSPPTSPNGHSGSSLRTEVYLQNKIQALLDECYGLEQANQDFRIQHELLQTGSELVATFSWQKLQHFRGVTEDKREADAPPRDPDMLQVAFFNALTVSKEWSAAWLHYFSDLDVVQSVAVLSAYYRGVSMLNDDQISMMLEGDPMGQASMHHLIISLLYKGEAAFSFMMQNKPSHLLFVLNFNMETGQCVEPHAEMWRHVALCVEPYLPPNSLAGLKSILKWFTQRMIELDAEMRNLMQHVCCTEVLASNITSIVTKPSFDLESLDPFIIKETLIKRIENIESKQVLAVLMLTRHMFKIINLDAHMHAVLNSWPWIINGPMLLEELIKCLS